MLKKSITFKDLDGNEIVEDFYFSLSKADIAEMELSKKGGLSAHLETIVADENGGEIIKTFKEIIQLAIGKRSADNRRFIKSQEIIDEFVQSDAYSVLFMELVTDDKKGAEFINGIIPADMLEAVAAGQPVVNISLPSPEDPAWVLEKRDPTDAELRSMTTEQMQDAFRRKLTASE